MATKKKRKCFIGILLLMTGVCFVLSGIILITQVPDHYQYIVPAGNMEETWKGALKTVKSIGRTSETISISGRRQKIQLPGVMKEANITLYAIDSYYADIHHETLLKGRMISEGDVLKQRDVIVIDQNTAFILFAGGDAVGKSLTIDHTEWTVAGIVANQTRLGENTEGIAFIPISSAVVHQLSMDTVEIRLSCMDGIEKLSFLQTGFEQWCPSGSFYALEREKYAALMPLHWSAVIISLFCTALFFRRLVTYARTYFFLCQKKLESHYPRQIFFWSLKVIIWFLTLTGAAFLLMILTLNLITAPAVVFTEWIPENPVSISSYANCFWEIQHKSAKAIQYITCEKTVIMLASWLVHWGTIAALGGVLITKMKWRKTI